MPARPELLDPATGVQKALGLGSGLAVVYLVLVPLAMLVFSSFRATGSKLPFEATGFTLANYVTVFSSGLTYRLLLNTLWYAVGSLLIGMTLATIFGWLLERSDMPGRRLMTVFMISSLAVPGLVQGMAWVMLANANNGLLNIAARQLFGFSDPGPFDIYSIPGMILVTGTSIVAPLYMMISGTFNRMDPSLEDAGRLSGASWLVTFKRITVPLLRPGLLAAAIYYFMVVSEMFDVPALLGMGHGIFMFSTTIYLAAHPATGGIPDYGLASGYAMVSIGMAVAFITLYSRSVSGAQQFAVVTGKGYRPQPLRLGRWRNVAAAALAAYFALTFLLPFLILVWTSLLPFYAVPSLEAVKRVSLTNYAHLLRLPSLGDTLRNSALVMVLTACLTAGLAALVAWNSVRSTYRGSKLPDRLTFVIAAIPSIVVGLALTFLYVSLPLPIYGTSLIIAIALVTRYLPFATRVMDAALLQLHRELEEAAQLSGAGFGQLLSRVVVPLIWPSFTRAWLWAGLHAMRDTTISIMLFVTSNGTLGALLWLIWTQYADIGMATALAVPLVLGSTLLTFLLARTGVSGGRPTAAERQLGAN